MKVYEIYLQVLYWIQKIFLFFGNALVEKGFLQCISIFETHFYFVTPEKSKISLFDLMLIPNLNESIIHPISPRCY